MNLRAWRSTQLAPLWRQPLLQFVLLGTAIFGADALLAEDESSIVITPAIRSEIEQTLRAEQGRPPTDEEQRQGLQRWKRDEVLYREAVKLGLAEGDATVRAHLAAKMLAVGRERQVLAEPSDVELQRYFQEHRDTYTTPRRFDVDHVFIAAQRDNARAAAELTLAKLRSGAAPLGLGDPFPRGQAFSNRSSGELEKLFGEEAARALPEAAVGAWVLTASERGFHLLRVRAARGGNGDFEQLRDALRIAYQAAQRERAAERFAQQIERRYRFLERL